MKQIRKMAWWLIVATVVMVGVGLARAEKFDPTEVLPEGCAYAQLTDVNPVLPVEETEEEVVTGWGFGAGLVPPCIAIDFDGGKKVSTGFNTEEGGASVSIFKGQGFNYLEFGLDSYFRFEQGGSSSVGFGGHCAFLEKNNWSLFRLAVIGWVERGDGVDWTLGIGIGLPNIYEKK